MKFILTLVLVLVIIQSCGDQGKINKYSKIKIIQTSRDGDKLSNKGIIELSGETSENLPVVQLMPEKKYQKILGFGGSFTESSAYVLNQLSSEKRQQVIEAYFSSKGAAYSLTRTHINSCDFSLNSYSYAPIPDDKNLDNFSIKEDLDDIIPLIKDAMEVSKNGFKIIASPWTAPPWMKDKNTWFGGALKPEYYATWALYFSKYIKAYTKQGIDIWGITVENEPLGNGSNWESMIFTPQTMSKFLKNYLIPHFIKEQLNTEILIYDQNRDHAQEWVDHILGDLYIAQNVWGTAVHWYSSTYDWYPETLNRIHEKFPEKHILHSEGCVDSEIPVWQDDDWYWRKEATDWGYTWAPEEDKHLHPKYVPVYRYARDIIGGLNSWLEGWIDWNMILNTQGGPNHVKNWCLAPVIANTETDEVYYTPMFYILNHFSKYIRPGAQRIGIDNGLDELMITACKNVDGKIAVQILNQSDLTFNFILKIGSVSGILNIPENALQTALVY